MTTSIYITAILLSIWYINAYVLVGTDKQLVFVRTICLILILSVFAILISPKEVKENNVALMLGLIRDMTLIVVGFLFGVKKN
jgi:hypothetical protein